MFRRKIFAALLSAVLAVSILITPVSVNASAVTDMNKLVNSYWRSCSVMVFSLEDGPLYQYKQDTPFFCASIIKLPYADFVCRQITMGVRSLDDTMTYTSGWYHGGSGVIRHNGYGKTYTVRQLLDYMLRYSDNVAYDMLVYLFGTDGFNEMVSQWGYPVKLGTPSPRWPNVTASFMRMAMVEMYAHSKSGECWQVAWKALCESTDVLSRGVLGNAQTPVAIKYGLVEYVYHEVCFIDGPHPYCFIILSGASNYNCDAGFVKDTAACAGRIVAEHFSSVKGVSHLNGDLNDDDSVDMSDVLILKNILMNTYSYYLEFPEFADINQDGSVNIMDLNSLMNTIME